MSQEWQFSDSRQGILARKLAAFSLRLFRRDRVLALGADARKLERVTHRGIAPLLRDPVLEFLHHAILDRLDLVAGAADEIVVMMRAVAAADFVPGRAVDPGHALDQRFLLQQRDEPEN